MTQILKQSTAVDVLIGPFLDISDGSTAETGESPSVKLSKNGQTLGAKNDATTPTHDADGYYNCELDTTDTNTVGTLVLTVAASANALPVRHEFQVLEENLYDALFGSGADGFDSNGDVEVASIANSAITSSTFASGAINAAAIAANAIGSSELDATAVNEIADGVWDEAQSGHTTAGTFGEIATEIADILTDTNELQTDDVPGLIAALNDITAAQAADAVWDEARAGHVSAGTFGEGVLVESLNTQAKADVNAEADTALTDYDPPTKAELDAGFAALNDISTADVLASGDVDGYSIEETLKLTLAALAGKLSGAATTTVTIRSADDTQNRITATVDGDGNRSALTLNTAG